MGDRNGMVSSDSDTHKQKQKKGMDSMGLFTSSFQNIQTDIMKQILSMQMDAMQNFANMLQILTRFNAVFKTTVQSNGRISIPEAERKALGIEEGDLVQVIIIPLEKHGKEKARDNDAEEMVNVG